MRGWVIYAIMAVGLAIRTGFAESPVVPPLYAVTLVWESTPVAMHATWDRTMRVRVDGTGDGRTAATVEVWREGTRLAQVQHWLPAGRQPSVALVASPGLDPWPTGRYELRLVVDGQVVARSEARVVVPASA